ncbi:gag-pol polyprotein [Tanacetum coccineum]
MFTQHNRSIVHTQYNKTPYELIRGRKPNVQYFHVFGSLCYPTNDRDDLGKMKPTQTDIGIFIEDEAPQIVSSSAEQIATEPNSPVLNENTDELIQEDDAKFDGNVFYNAPQTPMFEEAESSSTFQDPSNMHEFHQKHLLSDRWTKNHPIEQVIVSTIEPKIIKEAMLDHNWIESMQDELNQFKRLDAWELVECLINRNIIAFKWI